MGGGEASHKWSGITEGCSEFKYFSSTWIETKKTLIPINSLRPLIFYLILFFPLSLMGPFCISLCPISLVGSYPHPYVCHMRDANYHPSKYAERVTELSNTSRPASSACVKLDSCLYPVTNKCLALLCSFSPTQRVPFIHTHMSSLIFFSFDCWPN